MKELAGENLKCFFSSVVAVWSIVVLHVVTLDHVG